MLSSADVGGGSRISTNDVDDNADEDDDGEMPEGRARARVLRWRLSAIMPENSWWGLPFDN